MSDRDPVLVPLTERAEQNLAALRRGMARGAGVAFYILIAEGAARAELLRRLRAWSEEGAVPPLYFFPEGERAATAVESFLVGPGLPPPLHGAVLPDGDALIAARTPIAALNVARDRLHALIPGPVLLVVSAAGEVRLARLAPDLFDVRTASYLIDTAAAVEPARASASPLRWLQLPELCIGASLGGAEAVSGAGAGHDHDTVLRALIRSFADGGPLADRRPDLIFCIGDLAYSGKTEQYRGVWRFFDDLARATGVPTDRIFVVPGNHDVDRSRVGRAFENQLIDREAADAFFGPSGIEDRKSAFRRFLAFAQFQRERFGIAMSAERPYLIARRRIGEHRIGVIGLNTAWLAHQDDAQGKLVIGEQLVRQALHDLAEGPDAERPTVRFALLHHPLDWLRDFERDVITDLLLEGVDFILHGHSHAQHPDAVLGLPGHATILAAPPTYQGHPWSRALLMELYDREIALREHDSERWTSGPVLFPSERFMLRISRVAYSDR